LKRVFESDPNGRTHSRWQWHDSEFC
jgi:hypothetical protein